MQSLNLFHCIGRLGKNPEMKFTPSGREVTSGSIAMNRKWKDGRGETRQQTEWINFEAWGNAAKIINQYAAKGQLMYLQGRIQTDRVEARDGGPDKFFTKLVVLEFMFLGGGNGRDEGVMQSGEEAEAVSVPAEDDIPF